MSTEAIGEARRQAGICNACRYCEGYCAVFPALQRERTFTAATITQLANLCHDCRGCYYACQYAPPHEFNVNFPAALAEVRQESWRDFAVPGRLASVFHRSGVAIAVAVCLGFAALVWAVNGPGGEGGDSGDALGAGVPAQLRAVNGPGGEGGDSGDALGAGVPAQLRAVNGSGGEGFYAVLSHDAMVAIFTPAFLLPLVAMALSVRRYWRFVGGGRVRSRDLALALRSAAGMRHLAGGHGEGCNFEDEDRFSNARRWMHHATMYGFLLCFASTSVATIMHYAFDLPAPYGPLSPPKLLGVPGGLLLSLGAAGLAALKLRADRDLGARRTWGGEMAFVLLLFLVGASGLALYAFGASVWLPELLALHLGAVLAFFLLTPYTKMAHAFHRFAALVKDAQERP